MVDLRSLTATLVVLSCLGASADAVAAGDELAGGDLSSHEVQVAVGVPVPFSIHGHEPGESQTAVGFISHALLGYRWRPFASLNWLGVEAQLTHSYMSGSVDQVPGTVTWWTVSPHIVASVAPMERYPFLIVEAGAGPGLLRNTVYIDRDINKQVHSWGVQAYGAVGLQLLSSMRLSARLGVDLYAEPYDEPTWYNQPLGRTNFASFDVVVSLGWGEP